MGSESSRAQVSIAMACHNSSRHVRLQLQSISEQTVAPLEIVVSDDASSDDTSEIVADFARHAPFPVHFLSNSERVGWQSNFVRAAQSCSGAIIAFCDHDDYWLPGKVECITKSAETESWTAIVHRNAFLYPTSIVTPSLELPNGSAYARSAAFYGGFDGHRMAFRRELLPWLEFQHEFSDWLFDGPIAHDRLIMLAALTTGNVLYLDKVLTLFRRHGDQVTTGKQRPSVAQDYKRRSEVLANWIAALAKVQKTGLADTEGIGHMVDVLRRLLTAHDMRAALYETADVAGRLRKFFNMVAQRSYASRSDGALGLRSLVKDAVFAVRPQTQVDDAAACA